MCTRSWSTKIEGAAAKALILSTGEWFSVKVAGDKDEAMLRAGQIEEALERQYVAGAPMLTCLARPDEIGMCVVMAGPEEHYIILNRPPDDPDADFWRGLTSRGCV